MAITKFISVHHSVVYYKARYRGRAGQACPIARKRLFHGAWPPPCTLPPFSTPLRSFHLNTMRMGWLFISFNDYVDVHPHTKYMQFHPNLGSTKHRLYAHRSVAVLCVNHSSLRFKTSLIVWHGLRLAILWRPHLTVF